MRKWSRVGCASTWKERMLSETDRQLVAHIAKLRAQDEALGREFASAVLEARKRAGPDRFCVTDRETGEHLYCVGGMLERGACEAARGNDTKGVKKMTDRDSPGLPFITRDLMLSDLHRLAKQIQKPDETYEEAYSRALTTPEGIRAYEEHREAHYKIGSRARPTSRDTESIRKALSDRDAVMYRVEAEAQRRFPGLEKAEAISKYMTTPEGSVSYEEYRKVASR